MTGDAALRELDAIVGPAEATKGGWLGPAYDEMVRWLDSLSPAERDAAVAELPRWLADDTAWHAEAALALTERLRSPDLFDAAVARARELGVHDSDDDRREPWESFHRHLIPRIASCAISPSAVEYLDELADQAPWATSRSRRSVALAAWFARCFMRAGPRERPCVEQGLELLRASGDDDLRAELVSFLSALYRTMPRRRRAVEALLTPAERARFNW
ncbi:MAG: hypothetical protein M3N16_04580 [Actinomycetota bacterium]|nr:hypothetical protein [Actinomycetota bacterium]